MHSFAALWKGWGSTGIVQLCADNCVVQVRWTTVAVWNCWTFILTICVVCRFGGLLSQCGIVGLLFIVGLLC